jgi:hypothetical protein
MNDWIFKQCSTQIPELLLLCKAGEFLACQKWHAVFFIWQCQAALSQNTAFRKTLFSYWSNTVRTLLAIVISTLALTMQVEAEPWCRASIYQPSYNPIDETQFDALIDAYAIVQTDLPRYHPCQGCCAVACLERRLYRPDGTPDATGQGRLDQ